MIFTMILQLLCIVLCNLPEAGVDWAGEVTAVTGISDPEGTVSMDTKVRSNHYAINVHVKLTDIGLGLCYII